MTQRVPQYQRTSQRIGALLAQGVGDAGEVKSAFIQLVVMKVIEELLERR